MIARRSAQALLAAAFLLVLVGCGQQDTQGSEGSHGASLPAADPSAKYMNSEPAFIMADEVDSFISNLPLNDFTVASPDALQGLIDAGALVIDVREARDYEQGHIPGAVSMPLTELTGNLDRIPADRRVVFVGESGYRSALAFATVYMLQYYEARAFPGGYKAWKAAGKPLSTLAAEAPVLGKPDLDRSMLGQLDSMLEALTPEGAALAGSDDLERLAARPGTLVIDLREPDDFARGHIPGAANVPVRELLANLDLLAEKSDVVLVCNRGQRAGIAAAGLRLLGYEQARAFEPGFEGWREAGGEPVR